MTTSQSGNPANPSSPEPPAAGGTYTREHVKTELESFRAHRGTLPPPDFVDHGPRSAATITLEERGAESPVARVEGAPAELGVLEAKLAEARASQDGETERKVATELSRLLASKGTELDTATKLARKALILGDDPVLREELASWYAALGEPALAAKVLDPLVDEQAGSGAVQPLMRLAVLFARANDAPNAALALTRASDTDPTDPLPPELLGAIGAWAPDAVDAKTAAKAYVEGSRRRAARGDSASAFEDLLRAFELAPSHSAAVEPLVQALGQRGRGGASDEVLREHARAVAIEDSAAALKLHHVRFLDARDAGDLGRALGAALDAKLDGEIGLAGSVGQTSEPDGALAEAWLGLLERLNLHELAVAWLAVGAELSTGEKRARALAAVGRMSAALLGNLERALDAWIEGSVLGSKEIDLVEPLRQHAVATRDHRPLVEALVRIGLARDTLGAAREPALRELLALSEQRLSDPALAQWAARELVALTPTDAELTASIAGLSQRLKLQDEALRQADEELEKLQGAARADALKRIAPILEGRPTEADRYTDVLRELAELFPEQRHWRITRRRVLGRLGRSGDLEKLFEVDLEKATTVPERERAASELCILRLKRGDWEGATSIIAPFVSDTTLHPRAASLALVLGARGGNRTLRAEALSRLAPGLSPSVRAVALSVAAESWLEVGAAEAAARTVDAACRADPSLARPIAMRARTALLHPTLVRPDALERAVGVIVPRAELCMALSRSYDPEEPTLALAWTQRLLALRPGDLSYARELLERVIRVGDDARMADALGWLLSQPAPLERLAETIARALESATQTRPERAAALARRVLDVLGPRHEVIRASVLRVADAISDAGLGIAVIERLLVAGAPGTQRADLLLDLSRRRQRAGDPDGAARALMHSLVEGARADDVLAELDKFSPARGSDGVLALLEARAEALSALSGQRTEEAADAWRSLGAARWDLASDRTGALAAWQRASALVPADGGRKLVADLFAFAGPDGALTTLLTLARKKRDPEEAAALLAEAATAALAKGRQAQAFDLADTALEFDASRTDALAVAEHSASSSHVDRLERIYDRVSEAALGRYGERALHYRAARQLERRNETQRALAHAIRAFESVPAEGVTFVLMARLGQRVGQANDVIASIERVAAASGNTELHAAWLKRALLITDSSEAGRRERLDVLLRTLAVRPELDTVRSYSETLGAIVADAPEEREVQIVRFEHVVGRIFSKVDGPEGGFVALALARTALAVFDSPELTFRALTKALDSAADLEQYAEFVPDSQKLVSNRDEAKKFLDLAAAELDKRMSNLGGPLLELGASLAAAMGEPRSRAAFLVRRARLDPENSAWLDDAKSAARDAGDLALLEQVLELGPVKDRVRVLMDLSADAERKGDVEGALAALLRARAIEGIESEDDIKLFARLCDVHRNAGQRDALEHLMERELFREGLPAPERIRYAGELAAMIGARGDPARAIDVLSITLRDHPDRGLYGDMVALARQAGDRRREVQALTALTELTTHSENSGELVEQLHNLAELLEQLGEQEQALVHHRKLLELDPDDIESIAALERDAERRGDFEAVVELLGRRATLASLVDEVRRIRLRRASVLEQRLARPEEARDELEALLAATGDHLSVLRVLADLNERLGAPGQAARLWFRASAATSDRAEAADLSRRACEAYLRAGDLEGARRILDGMQAWVTTTEVLKLRVELSRRSEDAPALATALEDLAMASPGSAHDRAGLLVEAAELSRASGDQDAALSRAQRAARIAPDLADAQILARLLEYLHRVGPGSREEARATVVELRALGRRLDESRLELYTFLLAEALDVALGAGAGQRELEESMGAMGPRPLISLGIAERAAQARESERAARFFDYALAGDLRELRPRGYVLIAAAENALALGDRPRARSYLDAASAEPDFRTEAVLALSKLDALEEAEAQRAREHAEAERIAAEQARLRELEMMRAREEAEREAQRAREQAELEAARARELEMIRARERAEAEAQAARARELEMIRARERAEAEARAREEALRERERAEAQAREWEMQLAREREAQAAREREALAAREREQAARDAAGRYSVRPERGTQVDVFIPEPARVPSRISEPPPAPATHAAPEHASHTSSPEIPASRRSTSPRGTEATAGRYAQFVDAPPERLSAPPVSRETASSVDRGWSQRPVAPPMEPEPPDPPEVEQPVPSRQGPLSRTMTSSPPSSSSPPPRSDTPAVQIVQRTPALAQTMQSVPAPAEPQARLHSSNPPALKGPSLARTASLTAVNQAEMRLVIAFEQGDIDAGRALIDQLSRQPERIHEMVIACRRMVKQLPGDAWSLEQLRQSALQDRDVTYARAVGNVIQSFTPGAPPSDVPALSEQQDQPDAVRAMLQRDLAAPGLEGLALVWDGAAHVFRRDASSYGVTGLERVGLGAPTALGRAFGDAVRLFGATRTACFQRRSAASTTVSVALLTPPALIVSGDVEEESEQLLFQLGSMLAATQPQYVLLFGSDETQARTLLKALSLAFGPPQPGQRQLATLANLAEVLWESIPTRAQRRLRELCDDPMTLDYDSLMRVTRMGIRRAGLFVSGDIRTAVNHACETEKLGPPPADLAGLAELAQKSEAVADLVRFATAAEFAETRWQTGKGSGRFPTSTWAG